MTDDDVVPVMAEVLVAKPPIPRRLRLAAERRWLALFALAVVCAVLAASVVILLVHGSAADRQREQLACQIELLGGQPIGAVHCPPAVKASPRPSPRASTSPTPLLVLVVPASPSPAGSPEPIRTPPPAPVPRGTTASPRPSPSSRATPSPTPVVRVCLPGVPCFPR